ncbi:hypothetical protein C1893_27280 [Pseudomonas sp. MPR-ANC1]|nr:hypothetical protein C1893_27280 [Pseudomonas sp. MPR-ANC1]
MLPLGCVAAPNPIDVEDQADRISWIMPASQPSASKLPRHKSNAALVWRFPFPTRPVHDDRNPPGDPQRCTANPRLHH